MYRKVIDGNTYTLYENNEELEKDLPNIAKISVANMTKIFEKPLTEMTDYITAKATNDYRLCKKSNGELVLQKLYEEYDVEHQYIGEYWQDIETVEEANND